MQVDQKTRVSKPSIISDPAHEPYIRMLMSAPWKWSNVQVCTPYRKFSSNEVTSKWTDAAARLNTLSLLTSCHRGLRSHPCASVCSCSLYSDHHILCCLVRRPNHEAKCKTDVLEDSVRDDPFDWAGGNHNIALDGTQGTGSERDEATADEVALLFLVNSWSYTWLKQARWSYFITFFSNLHLSKNHVMTLSTGLLKNETTLL